MNVLVLNSGSSSIKYQLFEARDARVLTVGTIEKIGEPGGRFVQHLCAPDGTMRDSERLLSVADARAGYALIVEALKQCGALHGDADLFGIGHRVVHGGKFEDPALIDDAVISEIRAMIPLAPLHNGPNLAGIEIARELFPRVPQVAVFDTAFHQTMPPRAFTYPLPREIRDAHHIRRYGFHGTSHSFVARQAAAYLQRPLESLKLITLHLGNGASAAAIQHGASIDTSMGMTPLEGLMMGTRCGDLDPEIPTYLMRVAGLSYAEVEKMLNSASGLKGLCGVNDMREVERLAASGNADAELALEIFCYRVKKYIGAYLAALGGADAIVFTAGIGEHSATVRARSCRGLERLGIVLDDTRNRASSHGINEIQAESTDTNRVKILVIPTNEELELLRLTVDCINARSKP